MAEGGLGRLHECLDYVGVHLPGLRGPPVVGLCWGSVSLCFFGWESACVGVRVWLCLGLHVKLSSSHFFKRPLKVDMVGLFFMGSGRLFHWLHPSTDRTFLLNSVCLNSTSQLFFVSALSVRPVSLFFLMNSSVGGGASPFRHLYMKQADL